MLMHDVQRPALTHVQTMQEEILRHAKYTLAKRWEDLTTRDMFLAAAMAVRDSLIDGMLETEDSYRKADAKCLTISRWNFSSVARLETT